MRYIDDLNRSSFDNGKRNISNSTLNSNVSNAFAHGYTTSSSSTPSISMSDANALNVNNNYTFNFAPGTSSTSSSISSGMLQGMTILTIINHICLQRFL